MSTFFARWHWLVVPALLFIAFGSITTAALHHQVNACGARCSPLFDESFAESRDSSHGDLASSWDGGWYKSIVEDRYPDPVPLTPEGRVDASNWAFYPLYPSIVRGVMAITGLPFDTAGIMVSLLFTLAGLVLLYRWIFTHMGRKWPAALAVASLLSAPASFVFQATYTEGLTLFLLVAFLWLLSSKRYLTAIPVVVALGLTRNVVPPLLLVGLAMGIAQARFYIRSTGLPLRESLSKEWAAVARYSILGIATVASFLLWPAIVGIATGRPNAYMETYRSWFGGESTFGIWFTEAPFSAHNWYAHGTLVVLLPVFAAAAYLAFNRHSGYPLALRVYPLAIATYIFTMTGLSGSEWRYLTLGFFLWPFTRIPKTTEHRVVYFGCLALVLLASFAASYWWIGHRWLIPPGSPSYVPAP